MNQMEEKFNPCCLDTQLAGKKHIEWLYIYEQEIEKCSYDSGQAIHYLNSINILGLLYARLKKWNKFERLTNHVETLINKIPEYKEEANCTYMLLKQRLCKENSLHSQAKDLLNNLSEYAIAHDDKILMCMVLNRWGNLFSSLCHTDLSSLFYGYSLEFAYQCRNEFGCKVYSELASYPISNLLSAVSDDDTRMDLFEKVFIDTTFDTSTRIYFGNRLKSEFENREQDFSEYQQILDSLVFELYAEEDCRSHSDQLVDFYVEKDYDGMDAYYEKWHHEFDPSTHIFYYLLSEKDDKATYFLKWINRDTFYEYFNSINYYISDLSQEYQEQYFIHFLDYIRNLFFTLDFNDCDGFLDFLKSSDSLFSQEQVGELLLNHSTDNGLYEYVEPLIISLEKYCKFEVGTDWLEDAILQTGLGAPEFQEVMLEHIKYVLKEQCCFANKYPTIQSNIQVCRNLLDDTDKLQENLNIRLIQKTNEYIDSPAWRIFERAGYSEKNEIPTRLGIETEESDDYGLDYPLHDKSIVHDAHQYEDIQLVKDNKDYQKLKQLMEDNGWELDEKDLNINLLHAKNGDDDQCLLYLFYAPDSAWLGDEERFNDEDPLWFSESSHLVSPVWRIRNYINNRNITSEELTQYPTVVMLPPTYVINGDDMKNSWEEGEKVVVLKYRELVRSLETSGTIPKSTDYEEVSSPKVFYGENNREYNAGVSSKEKFLDDATSSIKRERIAKTRKENIEGQKAQAIDGLNAPLNLFQVYKVWKSTPYHRDKFGDNTSKPIEESASYDLTKIGLLKVVEVFLKSLEEWPSTEFLANHTHEATIALYFRNTSVKFRLTADWEPETNKSELKEFIIDSFNDDRMDFIKGVDRNIGRLDGDDLYFRGNLVSELFEIVIRIKNVSGENTYIDSAAELEKLSLVAKIFNDALVSSYSQEVWEQGVSGVSAPILIDVVKRQSEKTAKTAIMSRNMSHNLGSHVMAYLKRDLASVGDIMRKGVLHDFYPLPDDFVSRSNNGNDNCNLRELLKLIETHTKEVEMPFLVGLGKFISYLQERQDFIATVATFYIPYFSAVNFKDDIYDTINPDYRYLRHSDRRGNRPENILMKYIALSEGLSRDITQQGPRKNDIVIRFRKFDGTNDYLLQKQRHSMKPNGPGRADLNDMRQYSFYLPGGIVGRQALFTILENLIRNSAKHGLWRQKHNLEFTFDLHRGRDFDTNPHSSELYAFLKEEPEWMSVLSSEESPLNKFYILTLTDNLDIDDSSFNSLKASIKEEYVSAETGKMINKHKGIKEIRISAAWMRGIADDLNIPSDEPPVITVRKVNNSLQYIFCVLAPKKVLLLVNDKDKLKQLQIVIKTWEGWYADSIDHYKKTNDKSYDIIVLHDESDMESLRPISADRLVVAEELTNSLLEKNSDQEELEVSLYKKLYHIQDNDEPLLISDGKTGYPISSHIRLVSADAEVLASDTIFRYCYRTHHQDPQEFSDYMNSILREHMNAVEGITGNNSTDRLIRNEKLDDIWYFKHLHALRTKIAIFDERMFSKITGLEDKELTTNLDSFVKGSRESVVYAQKRVWFFNVIYDEDHNLFNIFGLQGESTDEKGLYFGKITKLAEIVSQKTEMGELGVIPSISIIIYDDKYKKFADYISIHQGLMDKIYDAFKIKQKESYSEDVQKDSTLLSLAIKTAMCSASVRIYEAFYEGEETDYNTKDEFERLLEQFINGPGYKERRFCPGFFVHSGRSKPSEFDMPQKQPFIQYAAIENAAYDCKYSLVELLKSARYEPSE